MLSFFKKKNDKAAAATTSAATRYAELVQKLADSEEGDLTPAEGIELTAISAMLAATDAKIESDALIIRQIRDFKAQAATAEQHRTAMQKARATQNAYQVETDRIEKERAATYQRLWSDTQTEATAFGDAEEAGRRVEELLREHAARLALPAMAKIPAHLFDVANQYPAKQGVIAFALAELEITATAVIGFRFDFAKYELVPATGQTPAELAKNVFALQEFDGDQFKASTARDYRQGLAAQQRDIHRDASRSFEPRTPGKVTPWALNPVASA